jgi:hypothetical protein
LLDFSPLLLSMPGRGDRKIAYAANRRAELTVVRPALVLSAEMPFGK